MRARAKMDNVVFCFQAVLLLLHEDCGMTELKTTDDGDCFPAALSFALALSYIRLSPAHLRQVAATFHSVNRNTRMEMTRR